MTGRCQETTGELRPILVVEDDEDIRLSLRYILEDEGYTVAEATHGREALAWLATGRRPCLILLDLMMPVMTGLEFLAALRGDPQHAGTPVVLASAWPERAVEAVGIQGFIKKPFKLAELLDQARRYC
jgi:CheY-like chemotaxis protein